MFVCFNDVIIFLMGLPLLFRTEQLAPAYSLDRTRKPDRTQDAGSAVLRTLTEANECREPRGPAGLPPAALSRRQSRKGVPSGARWSGWIETKTRIRGGPSSQNVHGGEMEKTSSKGDMQTKCSRNQHRGLPEFWLNAKLCNVQRVEVHEARPEEVVSWTRRRPPGLPEFKFQPVGVEGRDPSKVMSERRGELVKDTL